MARPLRIVRPGAWYHITGRGNERKSIYRHESDRKHFCDLLAEMTEQFQVRIHAFVLMENHYHLLLELKESNLSRAVQWLNVSYSMWFNRRYDRVGHLFQGRFKSVVVNPQEWALSLSRYIHLNPIRISQLGLNKTQQQRNRVGAVGAPDPKLVHQRISMLREYRWSSFRAYAGFAEKSSWMECEEILKFGGGKAEARKQNYRKYVEAAVREGMEKTPWEDLRNQTVLGGTEFIRQLKRGRESGLENHRLEQLGNDRPDWNLVIASVEKAKGEKWAEFRDRHGDRGRDQALYLARRHAGLKLIELAQAAGLRSDACAAMILRRYEARLKSDRSEQEALRRASEMLIVRT